MRGLKSVSWRHDTGISSSHPSRDAWIEMPNKISIKRAITSRIPRGMRGLKYKVYYSSDNIIWSHPSRDAWIEIPSSSIILFAISVASLAGCVDWNDNLDDQIVKASASHPSRDAWIEIPMRENVGAVTTRRIPRGMRGLKFNLLKSSSDRCVVASLAGCVDWNPESLSPLLMVNGRIPRGMRGLKLQCLCDAVRIPLSHPSRDAWIEIWI